MPIFTRRRLQAMLDELAPRLGIEKGRDLLNRLEDRKSVEQALPAEMELGLLWGLSTLGDLDIEPVWWGDTRRPDAYTESLVPGKACAIEIAAPNDNAISGEEAMDRVALQISDCASRVEKGVRRYLYFRFREESGYRGRTYIRRRLAPDNYTLSPSADGLVRAWIESGRSTVERLHISEPGLDVEVERTEHKQTRYHNIWSTMPPETHSIDANPLFTLLKRKFRQLDGAAPGVLRLIFLADAGSTLLNRIGTVGEQDHTRRRVSGREIISHFFKVYAGRVDAVVVFAPRRERHWSSFREELVWKVSFFGSPSIPDVPPALDAMVAALPSPRYEGYQARSLFRQGAFAPTHRGSHLGLIVEGGVREDMKVKFPARMLLDLLAGRMTPEMFRLRLGGPSGKDNLFKHWLDMGLTISEASMAPRDIDEDDDHLVLTFSDDPAARKLEINQRGNSQSESEGQ